MLLVYTSHMHGDLDIIVLILHTHASLQNPVEKIPIS